MPGEEFQHNAGMLEVITHGGPRRLRSPDRMASKTARCSSSGSDGGPPASSACGGHARDGWEAIRASRRHDRGRDIGWVVDGIRRPVGTSRSGHRLQQPSTDSEGSPQGGEQAGRLPGRPFRREVGFDGATSLSTILATNEPSWGWTTTSRSNARRLIAAATGNRETPNCSHNAALSIEELGPSFPVRMGLPDLAIDLAALARVAGCGIPGFDFHPDLLV